MEKKKINWNHICDLKADGSSTSPVNERPARNRGKQQGKNRQQDGKDACDAMALPTELSSTTLLIEKLTAAEAAQNAARKKPFPKIVIKPYRSCRFAAMSHLRFPTIDINKIKPVNFKPTSFKSTTAKPHITKPHNNTHPIPKLPLMKPPVCIKQQYKPSGKPKRKKYIFKPKSQTSYDIRARNIFFKNVCPLKMFKEVLHNFMWTETVKPDIIVRIGHTSFFCHKIVLGFYSNFFNISSPPKPRFLYDLPPTEVSPVGFIKVYEWMLTAQASLSSKYLLRIVQAARYLRIHNLLAQCWVCLNDESHYKENVAFMTFLEARDIGISDLQVLMMHRLTNVFLCVVASDEFLTLKPVIIKEMLLSNNLGVNSETEVLFAMVRWLQHDFKARMIHIESLASRIRFGLMPHGFLKSLMMPTVIHPIVKHMLELPTVKEQIANAIVFAAMQHTYFEEEPQKIHAELKRLHVVIPNKRIWVYDAHCKYHHLPHCPKYYIQDLTYTGFENNLRSLIERGLTCWKGFLNKDDITPEMPCC